MTCCPLCVMVGAAAFVSCAASALAQPTITALPIPAGYLATHAIGMSDDGSVVVGEIDYAVGNSGFRWTSSGGTVNLGNRGTGTNGFASGVSGNGQVVVGQQFNGSTPGPWRWSPGSGYTALTGITNASVASTNLDGSIIIGAGDSMPIRWTSPGTPQPLPLLAGAGSGDASRSDTSGNIIVGSNSFGDGTHGFHWVAGPGGGTVQDMGRLSGALNTNVLDLSRNGTTATGYCQFPSVSGAFRSRGFRWTAAGIVDLGVPAGLDYVYPQAVSGDGRVIVGSIGTDFSGDRPFIWTAQGGVVDFTMHLNSLGVNLAGWALSNAWDISADGSVVTGWGIYNGLDTSYVVSGLPVAPATGACCAGTTCSVTTAAACTGTFRGPGITCDLPSNPITCCKANFNQVGGLSVQDIFDFLNAWFSSDPAADFNGGGLSVSDIFDFLNAWFAGC